MVGAEEWVGAAVGEVVGDLSVGPEGGAIIRVLCALFDSGAVVDGEVEFGADEFEVVVQSGSCDEDVVVGRDEVGESLGEAFEEHLLVGVACR